MRTSSKTILLEKAVIFPAQEPRKLYEKGGLFMRTGLTKKQKVTEVYYNAKDPTAEVYAHDTKLKKRLLEYAAKFPELSNRPMMTSKAAYGSKLTKAESASD